MPETKLPRVLVADDEDAIRTLVVRLLRRAGFQTVEATDGQHAIEQLDAAEFDAVVLDLMMPRVDGFGVVEHLIETRPNMMEKTVMMTAFPKTAARERLHHLCSVLSKPFDTTELIQLVRTAPSGDAGRPVRGTDDAAHARFDRTRFRIEWISRARSSGSTGFLR